MIIRSLLRHCSPASRPLHSLKAPILTSRLSLATPFPDSTARRYFAAKTSADAAVEELQELYATARDEFEIAQEETEKKTVYATDDRAAAQEELANLKEAFETAVKKAEDEETGKEITQRVGQRVRELERAVEAMEELAKED